MSEYSDMQIIDMNKIEELFIELKDLQLKKLDLLEELEFYTILTNPPDIHIYINDLVYKRKLWSSSSFEKMSGYTLKEAIQMGSEYFHRAYYEEDRNVFIASKNQMENKSSDENSHGVYRYKTKSGKILWFYSRGNVFRYDSNGKPSLAICIGVNITEKILKEEHLKKLIKENYLLKYKGIKNLLSKQEKKVLKYLTEGFSSKEIAEEEKRSCHTIETHRKNILKKLELNNTAELIKLATSGGLIE